MFLVSQYLTYNINIALSFKSNFTIHFNLLKIRKRRREEREREKEIINQIKFDRYFNNLINNYFIFNIKIFFFCSLCDSVI